jgi:hypothetical protein
LWPQRFSSPEALSRFGPSAFVADAGDDDGPDAWDDHGPGIALLFRHKNKSA